MTLEAQRSLFGDGGMAPPQPRPTPDVAAIRNRLSLLLDTLRAASDRMPLSERDQRMWRIVVPNMTKWLPEDEGSRIRDAFAREMERLA